MSHSDNNLLKALSKPVDVRRLIDKLAFDLDDLEDAAMHQPSLRLKSGRLQVQMMLRKSQLKRELAAIIGKKSIRIRRKHGNSYTATAIKNELGYDSEVRHAQRKLDEAEALEAYAADLTESYKERSMAILNLTKLRASETNSELRAVKNQSEVEAMRKKAHHMRNRLEQEDFEV